MYRLHAFWRSSCSYRVRIALNLKGLAYEVEPVPLKQGKQTTEEFTRRNPSQQVPVLELGDGTQLAQSVAIFEYLEEAHPDPALWPKDPVARARCRQLVEVVNSGIQPQQNLYVMRRLKSEGVDPVGWARHHVRRGLLAYERLSEAAAGDFSAGDSPTFADCALVPQLYNARNFEIDVSTEMPRLAAIDARCADLAPFAAAHPDEQPDAGTG